MAWYGLMHIHRLYHKRRKLAGLLGTTTKSVHIILLFSKYFTGRVGGSEGLYTIEKRLYFVV